MKLRYYLFPFILFLAAYIADKQLYIGGFQDTFLRTATFLNYTHKVDMMDELQIYLQKPDRKKVLVLFGNSRTMSFENAYLEKKFPDWMWFNFSVPGGTTDYFQYLVEIMKKRSIRPDFAVITVSPQGFNRTPAVPMDEVLISGLSLPFIIRNSSNYSTDDLMNYAAKNLFWNYHYRPKAEVILERLSNDGRFIRVFRTFQHETAVRLRENRGSVPFQFQGIPAQNDEFLSAHAKNTWNDFFQPFNFSQGQLKFTEKTVSILQSAQVPTILLWAKVERHLRHMKDTVIVTKKTETPMTVRQIWVPYMEELSKKYNAPFYDMNFGQTIPCDHFYDSSHLASVCFPEFSDYIMAAANRK